MENILNFESHTSVPSAVTSSLVHSSMMDAREGSWTLNALKKNLALKNETLSTKSYPKRHLVMRGEFSPLSIIAVLTQITASIGSS